MNNYEKINPQKDFSVSECVWCYTDNNSCFIALIFKIIKTSFQRYSLKSIDGFCSIQSIDSIDAANTEYGCEPENCSFFPSCEIIINVGVARASFFTASS